LTHIGRQQRFFTATHDVLFTDDQISAIETDLWSIMTYSFFPKIGTAFIGQQAMQPGTKSVMQIATFAHCQFSWTNPNNDPGKKC